MKGYFSLRGFYLSSWAGVCVCALLLVGKSGACPPVVVAFSALACLWTMWPALAQSRPALRPRAAVLRVFCAGSLILAVQSYSQARDIVPSLACFLTALLPVRLFRVEQENRFWTALLCALLMSLLGLISGDGLEEYFLFFCFATLTTLLLNARHLYSHQGIGAAGHTHLPRGYLTRFCLRMAMGGLFGAVVFFVFPRTMQWNNPLSLRNKEAASGYTGAVDLSQDSSRESTVLAARVSSPDSEWLAAAGISLYLRGNTVSDFNGLKWNNDVPRWENFQNPKAIVQAGKHEIRVHKIKIYREPHLPQAILYPGVLLDLNSPVGLLGGIEHDGQGGLRRHAVGMLRYAYELVFSLPLAPEILDRQSPQQLSAQLANADYSRWLKIPNAISTAPYFKAWRDEVGLTANAPLAIALQKIRSHFRRNYRLQTGAGSALELSEFLSRNRSGRCEFFATATALLLRSYGVPTRIVLGYRGGDYNRFAEMLEVRESQAHAWTEAYVAGSGWYAFDMTPVTPVLLEDSWTRSLAQQISAMGFWLERYLVDYDAQSQQKLITELIQWRANRPGMPPLPKLLWPVAIALSVAVLAGSVFAYRRRRRRRGPRLPPYYQDLMNQAKRRGIEKRPAETYAEFHARLPISESAADIVPLLTRAIESELYAAKSIAVSVHLDLGRRIRQGILRDDKCV